MKEKKGGNPKFSSREILYKKWMLSGQTNNCYCHSVKNYTYCKNM